MNTAAKTADSVTPATSNNQSAVSNPNNNRACSGEPAITHTLLHLSFNPAHISGSSLELDGNRMHRFTKLGCTALVGGPGLVRPRSPAGRSRSQVAPCRPGPF